MRGLGHFRPSPATVIASIALLVALGGTSWAAVTLAPRSVNNAALQTGAVNSRVIANGQVKGVDLAPSVIRQGPKGDKGDTGDTGAAGPSDAYSRFLNGPIAVPTSLTTLTNLSIPQAGKYVVNAKAVATEGGGLSLVVCQLVAGTDTDTSVTTVYLAGASDVLANQLVHEFTAAGSIDYKCGAAVAGITASNIKMTAIKVGNLTNTG